MEILKVPKLNENMEAAMVGPWAKAVGQRVEKGEVLVELITDKATFELQAGETGVLRVATAAEKSTVPVGYALAVIGESDEEVPDLERANAALMESYASNLNVSVSAAPTGRVKATPAARRLARQKGIDLAEVTSALGIDGVVDKNAVQKFIRETR
jgi:pyruvate/2-oxoglutarate dehydrogenase complex dihydrolipoamide acyltransferase (E2) component